MEKIAVETAPGGPLADRPRRRTPGRRPERSDLSRHRPLLLPLPLTDTPKLTPQRPIPEIGPGTHPARSESYL